MGDKIESKRIAKGRGEHDSWVEGFVPDEEGSWGCRGRIGYPVMIKSIQLEEGGKGMRIAW